MNKLLILGLLLTGVAGADPISVEAANHYKGCKANIKNLATACEMYGSDHGGADPKSIKELMSSGKYLGKMPICPASGKDSYSASYTVKKDHYSFCCQGSNHKDAHSHPNRPAYDSVTGLIEGNQ